MEYLEEPKYDLLHQMIGQMFDPVKDEVYESIVKPFVKQTKDAFIYNMVAGIIKRKKLAKRLQKMRIVVKFMICVRRRAKITGIIKGVCSRAI